MMIVLTVALVQLDAHLNIYFRKIAITGGLIDICNHIENI